MADLKLNKRWEPYAPRLDGNHELERPFLLELQCGLTRAEMRAVDEQVRALHAERFKAVGDAMPELSRDASIDERREWAEMLADRLLEMEVGVAAEVLSPFVRMGQEPLTIAGKPVTTFRGYLEAVSVVSDQAALQEPLRALRAANSLNGEQVLFSKRRSGGSTTTPSRGAASRVEKTGER